MYLRRKEATKQIIDFYEDNISLFNTSQDKNELDIIQTIVYRYVAITFLFSYIDKFSSLFLYESMA